MSDNTQHIKQYSAADIRRYLQGQMTADEMHAIEKAALDDPFLADAIDGMEQTMQQYDSGVMAKHLQELNQELEKRITPHPEEQKPAPVISLRWWQAVAAAVVLITGSIFVYNSITRDDAPEPTLAVTEKQTAPVVDKKDSVPALSPATTDLVINETNPNAAPVTDQQDAAALKQRRFTPEMKTAQKKASPAATNEVAEYKTNVTVPVVDSPSAPVLALSDKADDKNKASSGRNQAAIASVTKDDSPQNNAAKKQSEEIVTEVVRAGESNVKRQLQNQTTIPDKELSNVIRGKVTDPFNNPLANAQVSPQRQYDTNVRNYLTDRNGFFRIPTSDSVVNVAITAQGYESRNLKLQQNLAYNQVQLQPAAQNNASNQVQVSGYRNQSNAALSKQKTKDPTILVQDAQPVYGWVGYEEYLEKNKRIPDNAASVSGEVVVSFMVSRKGSLSDFKVEQSLSKELDEEAIRLIKEGPSWKVLKGRKARAMVIVKF